MVGFILGVLVGGFVSFALVAREEWKDKISKW